MLLPMGQQQGQHAAAGLPASLMVDHRCAGKCCRQGHVDGCCRLFGFVAWACMSAGLPRSGRCLPHVNTVIWCVSNAAHDMLPLPCHHPAGLPTWNTLQRQMC
jgi:hypothetical protein